MMVIMNTSKERELRIAKEAVASEHEECEDASAACTLEVIAEGDSERMIGDMLHETDVTGTCSLNQVLEVMAVDDRGNISGIGGGSFSKSLVVVLVH